MNMNFNLKEFGELGDRFFGGVSRKSESAGSVPAHLLTWENFPACCSKCMAVEALGVGECESVCPHKFDENGNALDLDEQNVTDDLQETGEKR